MCGCIYYNYNMNSTPHTRTKNYTTYRVSQCCRDYVFGRNRLIAIYRDIKPLISINNFMSSWRLLKKPAILPLKRDQVPVDRKKHESGVCEHFGIHKEYSASSWVVCIKCSTWVSTFKAQHHHHQYDPLCIRIGSIWLRIVGKK